MAFLSERIINFLRKKYIDNNRERLKNTSPTVIASNCNGAFILHDLKLRYNSPFVNLWIKPKDFIKILSNFNMYMNATLVEIKEKNVDYPVEALLDVKVYFQHYSSFEEAVEKWNKRKERIDRDNFFVFFTDRDGCTYEDLKKFDNLPIKNKIVFTHKDYDEIESAFYIKGFENKNEVGMCHYYMNHKIWMKYYNQFDFVKWFNDGIY